LHYQRGARARSAACGKLHRACEKLFVDYCGPTVPIVDAASGELLVELNARPFQKLPGSRKSAFEALDKPHLPAGHRHTNGSRRGRMGTQQSAAGDLRVGAPRREGSPRQARLQDAVGRDTIPACTHRGNPLPALIGTAERRIR
jgi:hypothetical protein